MIKILQKGSTLFLGPLFVAFFLFGVLYPNTWWGTHSIAFLEFEHQITIGLLILSAWVIPWKQVNVEIGRNSAMRFSIPLIGSIMYGILIYYFPIETDLYGDAIYFQDRLGDIAIIDEKVRSRLFGFDLDAWAGQKTVMALASYISFYLNITELRAFRLLDLVCGMSFAATWIYFLLGRFTKIGPLLTLTLVGLSSPFALIFFGHTEIYAPSIFATLLWSISIANYFKKPTKVRPWFNLLLAAICVKLHPIGILLLPSSILLIVTHHYSNVAAKLSWKLVGRYVVVPVIVFGLGLYFFVLGDHLDNRSLQIETFQYDHLFLPIFSPSPPLHKYNLFSWNHILDYLNIMLLWSPAALFLFVWMLTKTGASKLKSKSFVLIGLSFAMYASLLFVINPLLTMPMDWDLYCLPVPFLLVLTALSVDTQAFKLNAKVVSFVISLTVLSSAFIVLHQSDDSYSKRIEAVGIHVYKTYYEWTSHIIANAYALAQPTDQEYRDRRTELMEQIQPIAAKGFDYEYSHVLKEDAKYLLRKKKDYAATEELLKLSMEYLPHDKNALVILLETYFVQRKFDQAYGLSVELIQLEHPSEEAALRTSIHCALEAKRYDEAFTWSVVFLNRFKDPVIRHINSRLAAGQDIETLKSLFRQSNSSDLDSVP